MQFELFAAVHADQHRNSDQATGVTRQAGAGPDITPGVAGDHFLKFAIELGQGIEAAIDMGITQHFTAYAQTCVVTLFLVHKTAP